MIDSSDAPWLVLRTKSRQENVVEDILQQKDIRAFLPKRNEERVWKDRTKSVETALFPGYLFVQPRPEQLGELRHVRGSCGLLMNCGKHAQIVERDLATIKIMVGSGAALAVADGLVQGEEVEVIAGPFRHARGEFVRARTSQRLVINAHLIGRSLSVEIDAAHVQPTGRTRAWCQ